jgi:hypothetical protein
MEFAFTFNEYFLGDFQMDIPMIQPGQHELIPLPYAYA